MSKLFFIIMFSVITSFAQSIPHEAKIIPSKMTIRSSEEFTIEYSLTEVEGYVYIGLNFGDFEAVGSDRWEGEIKPGEVKKITFTLRLKEEAIEKNLHNQYNIAIGFSHYPFDERITECEASDGITITLSNYLDLKTESRTKSKINIPANANSQQLNLHPFNCAVPRLNKTYSINPNSPKLDYEKPSSQGTIDTSNLNNDKKGNGK